MRMVDIVVTTVGGMFVVGAWSFLKGCIAAHHHITFLKMFLMWLKK